MWYYVENGQQQGPVSDEEISSLQRSGKITGDTFVWREGMANWLPFRDTRPAASGGGLICVECGNAFQPDQVIRINDRWVCATCKPIFLQRMREGAVIGAASVGSLVSEAQVRERDYEHSIGDYFSKSWQIFKADPGNILGACMLIGLCLLAANMIPYLSIILALVFTGPLLGGLYLFSLKKIRGQTATIGDAFSGFSPRFGQLLLGHFIPGLFVGLIIVPVGIAAAVVVPLVFRPHGGGSTALGFSIIGFLVFAAICLIIYFQICWMFTLWLVADKNMTFWPAMSLSRAIVSKHWWHTFLLAVVTWLLAVAGMLLCFIGLLVTGPLVLLMWAHAYERMFGDMQPA